MKISPLLALAALGLLDVSAMAQGVKPDVLARIRSVFQSTDTNGDGELGVAEARRKGIPAIDFAVQDADKSGALSADEFYVYYRQLLSKAGRRVPASLEQEVARVVAARKAAASGEQPGATPGEEPVKTPSIKPVKPAVKPAGKPVEVEQPAPSAGDDPARRAQQLIKRLVDGGSVSAEDGRALYAALVTPTAAAGDVTALGDLRSALNQARTRVGPLVQSGSLSASEARELSAFFSERASSAAQALVAAEKSAAAKQAEAQTPEAVSGEVKQAAPVTVTAPFEAPPASSGLVPDAAPNTPARRAQQLVKRLVDGGSLSADQGREMFAALADPEAVKGDPKALGEIRSAVNSARMRLGSLEQAGKLDAEDARLLSELFNARGSAVAQALVDARGERASARDEGELSARQARAVVRRLATRGELTEAEGRGMILALADPASLTGGAEELVQLRQAVNSALPRVTALVQSGKLSVAEGRSVSIWFNRRAAQAAKAIESAVPAPETVRKVPLKAPVVRQAPDQKPQEAGGEDPARRAQKLVKALIDKGRVGAAEGRVMYQALTDPAMVGGDQAQLASLRTALDSVRPRISQLVSQGHLTVQEGRQLSAFFDARATAAAVATKEPAKIPERSPEKEPAREPKQRSGAKKKPAGERGVPGASKTPKVKNAGIRPAKGSAKRPAPKKGETPKKKGRDGGR